MSKRQKTTSEKIIQMTLLQVLPGESHNTVKARMVRMLERNGLLKDTPSSLKKP